MLRKRAEQEAFILAERNYEATLSSTRLCEPLHDRQSSLRRVNERSFVLGHLLVALSQSQRIMRFLWWFLLGFLMEGVLHGQFPEDNTNTLSCAID